MEKQIMEYYVIKRNNEYLEGVWEEWDEDVENYSFTDELYSAKVFYSLDQSAPKYLWDSKNGKSIDTLQDACDFFEAKIVKVSKTITWKEIE